MGRRGPAPEPAALRIAKGETRPSQLNRLEPIPRFAEPRAPRDMDKRAQAVWRYILREMRGTRTILAADAFVLRCFCEAVVAYIEAGELIAKTGLLVKRDGNLVKNPLLQVWRDNREAVRLFSRELGLSPAARAGLHVEVGPAAMGSIDEDIGPTPRQLALVSGRG